MCFSIVAHVTWVDIWDGFKYTTCSYGGFSRPMSGYTQQIGKILVLIIIIIIIINTVFIRRQYVVYVGKSLDIS